MRVIIEPDYENMSRWAAEYVAAKINAANPTQQKPFKLGCPTGSSPLGLYKHLIEMHKAGKVTLAAVCMVRENAVTVLYRFQKLWRKSTATPATYSSLREWMR